MKKNNEDIHKFRLEEFSEAIQESEFRQLIIKYRFIELFKQHKVKDGFHNQYIIGYGKDSCRIAFFYEPGVRVFVSATSSQSTDWDEVGWIGIDYIISYLLKKTIIREFDSSSVLGKEKIKARLLEIATRFNPLSEEIINMFKDNETVSKWRPSLEEYIREDTRRRYGLK